MRVLALLMLLGLLSACATTANLQELRHVTPRGTPYAIALTKHYLDFSEAEAKNYDWVDSSYFAEKGLMLGYGQSVSAEEIANWDVPEDIKPELVAARERLLQLTQESTRQKMPEQAAEATFAFDCWLEELEEGSSADAVSQCQTRLYAALDALEFDASAGGDRINNTAYLIYFGLDKSQFDDASKQVVTQVIADVVLTNPGEILIHGHTDTSGDDNYNMQLSEKRALSVLEALIKGGVPPEIIKYFAFGETDPAVPTGDGVVEPKNRRVEIFLG